MSYRRETMHAVFRWAPSRRTLLAVAVYSLIALALEYFLTVTFITHGLSEGEMLTLSLRVPASDITLTASVSPLIHLIPACVMIALVSSWMHVTEYALRIPMRKPTKFRAPKRVRRSVRRGRKGLLFAVRRRLKPLIDLWGRVKWKARSPFVSLWRSLDLGCVSARLQRMPFTVAAVKGALITLSAFSVLAVLVYLLEYPQTLYEATVNLYQGNPLLLNLVFGLHEAIRGLAVALGPLGWLPSAVNDALLKSAPSFKKALDLSLKPILEAFSGLNITWRYLVCQNLAALTSASIAIVYGRYRTTKR